MKKTTVLLPYPVPPLLAMAFKFSPINYQSNVEIEVLTKDCANVELELEIPQDVDVREVKGNIYLLVILGSQTLWEQAHTEEDAKKMFAGLLNWMHEHSPEFQKLSDRGEPGFRTELQKYLHLWIVKGGDLMGVDHRPCWEAKTCLTEEPDNG